MSLKDKKQKEKEILDSFLEDEYTDDTDNDAGSDPEETVYSEKENKTADKGDTIRCPRCARVLFDRSRCPYCGYSGYIPMTKSETKKIKLILYPIAIVALIIAYFMFRR